MLNNRILQLAALLGRVVTNVNFWGRGFTHRTSMREQVCRWLCCGSGFINVTIADVSASPPWSYGRPGGTIGGASQGMLVTPPSHHKLCEHN